VVGSGEPEGPASGWTGRRASSRGGRTLRSGVRGVRRAPSGGPSEGRAGGAASGERGLCTQCACVTTTWSNGRKKIIGSVCNELSCVLGFGFLSRPLFSESSAERFRDGSNTHWPTPAPHRRDLRPPKLPGRASVPPVGGGLGCTDGWAAGTRGSRCPGGTSPRRRRRRTATSPPASDACVPASNLIEGSLPQTCVKAPVTRWVQVKPPPPCPPGREPFGAT